MSEEINTDALPEGAVEGNSTPQGVTEIPNGVNIPISENISENQAGEKILGKFESQEALVKAYQELEQKLGSNEQQQSQEQPAENSPELVNEDGSFDISQYSEEFAKNGELSEDSYRELQEVGFSKDIVDAYIQGQAALGNQWGEQVKAMVGSNEQYQELIEWAGSGGVDEAFIQAYDEAIGSMDPNRAKMAVEALKSLYAGANNEPKLLDGTTIGSGSGDVYESWKQVTTDLNSKLYHSDPAERERVQQKLARSNI